MGIVPPPLQAGCGDDVVSWAWGLGMLNKGAMALQTPIQGPGLVSGEL